MELILLAVGIPLYLLVGVFVTYFISGVVDELPPVTAIPIVVWPFTIVFWGVLLLATAGYKLIERAVNWRPGSLSCAYGRLVIMSYSLGKRIGRRS